MKHAPKAALVAIALTATAGALAGWGATSSTNAAETTAVAADALAKAYSVDPVHSNVIFKIRHGGLSNFYGRFNNLSGTIEFNKRTPEKASINIAVELESLDTKNSKRDAHVKGADFFNARQYPKATFVSTSVTENDEGGYTLTGDFTIHGETKPITATMSPVDTGVQQGKSLMGFEARFSIKRSAFGITTYVDTANPEDGSLGDTVELIVAIEAVSE